MERPKELTIFRIGSERTTYAEWRIRPTIGTALKATLIAGGILGVSLAAKYGVDWMDDVMRPIYIVNGASVPEPEPTPVWVPRTNWQRGGK